MTDLLEDANEYYVHAWDVVKWGVRTLHEMCVRANRMSIMQI